MNIGRLLNIQLPGIQCLRCLRIRSGQCQYAFKALMKTLLAAPGYPFKVSKCWTKAKISTFWIGNAACPACHGLCGRSFLAGAEVSIGHLPIGAFSRATQKDILDYRGIRNFLWNIRCISIDSKGARNKGSSGYLRAFGSGALDCVACHVNMCPSLVVSQCQHTFCEVMPWAVWALYPLLFSFKIARCDQFVTPGLQAIHRVGLGEADQDISLIV